MRPCIRIGPDGFVLHETVAEYIEILTLYASELKSVLGITPIEEIPGNRRVRIFAGGALIFNEYGQLKYHIPDRIEDLDRERQKIRLECLAKIGFFADPPEPRSPSGQQSHFARLHQARATR